MVVAEYGPSDQLLTPPYAQLVPCTLGPGVTLHHTWIKPRADTLVSSWLLSSDSAQAEPSIRFMRICLAQLHATRECLELVLHSIAAGKLVPAKDREARQALQDYFDATRRRLSRVRARSQDLGVAFTDAAEEAFAQINPFTEQLLEKLKECLNLSGWDSSTPRCRER